MWAHRVSPCPVTFFVSMRPARDYDEAARSWHRDQPPKRRTRRGREIDLQDDNQAALFLGGTMLSRFFVAAAALLGLFACGGGEEAQEIPLVQVQAAWYASWPVRQYVVRTQADWEAAWSEPVTIGNPRPALPEIDFSSNGVLGVSNGWGGCRSFRVKSVYRAGNDYVVRYGTSDPPPFTGCAAVLVPEVSLVLVPQPIGRVDFVRVDD